MRRVPSALHRVPVSAVTFVLAIRAAPGLSAQQAGREPLPIQSLVRDSRLIAGQVLSPDAQWVAIQYSTMDESLAGPPPLEEDGYSRAFRVSVVNTRTKEVIELGDRGAETENPSWSADGEYLIYVQKRGGHDELLMWNRRTRASTSLDFIGKRHLRIEDEFQWLPDGHRFIVSASVATPATERERVAERGPKLPVWEYDFPQFGAAHAGEASVQVVKTAALKNAEPERVTAVKPAAASADSGMIPPPAPTTFLIAVDIQRQTVEQLTDSLNFGAYVPSPDGRSIAYTVFKGWALPDRSRIHDLLILDLKTRTRRVIARDLPIWWGNTVSWSPDSRSLAWLTIARVGGGQAFHLSLADGVIRRLGNDSTPTFQRMDATGYNFRTQLPRWDASGENIHLVSADGALWRLNARSGAAKRLVGIDKFQIQNVLTVRNRPLPASGSVYVTARPSSGSAVGLFKIDLNSGVSREVTQPAGVSSGGSYSVAANGNVSMVLQGAQRPRDVWVLENGSNELREVSELGDAIRRYPLASVKTIDYISASGDHLRGALLLPPGFERGRKYPTVVWVYGGRGGAEGQDHFGLEDDTPFYNLQMFATRGYAVLFPEAPLRTGTPVKDLVATVMPAVDKVIELGYTDPDLLAVAGHSYGSYCSLALLTRTTRFKVGLIGGMRDWDLFSGFLAGFRTNTSFGAYYETGQGNIGGTPWTQQQRYIENSPFFSFDKIQAPILMIQGARDALLQADKNFKALSALGKKVEYRIYEDEGHVLMRGVDVADYWQHQLDFLATNLKVARDANGVVLFDGTHARRTEAPK